MHRILIILLSSVILGCSGCATDRQEPVYANPNQQQIEVVAKLIDFDFEAVFDDFEDYAESYDVSYFVIQSPVKYASREFVVLHKVSPDKESVWRQLGQVYLMHVDQEVIVEPDTSVFTTGIRIVRFLAR